MLLKRTTKLTNAKRIGSYHLLLLALFLVVEEGMNNSLDWLDLSIVVLAALPLLVNKKALFLCYGIVLFFVWLLFGIVVFNFHVSAIYADTLSPYWVYLAQYLFVGTSLFCALLLVYYGLYGHDKRENATTVTL
jgi:ABC-type arginine/histidine transport system permease subunit